MPLKNMGNGCWQWGDHGHKYCGPNAKQQAIKQGYAETGGDEAKFKNEMKSKASLLNASDILYIQRLIAESSCKNKHDFLRSVANSFNNMDETKSYVSQEERNKMDSSDFGWPEEKKYPVKDEDHFKAAVKLLGRAPKDKQEAIKKNLIKIAKRKGYSIPDSWS